MVVIPRTGLVFLTVSIETTRPIDINRTYEPVARMFFYDGRQISQEDFLRHAEAHPSEPRSEVVWRETPKLHE